MTKEKLIERIEIEIEKCDYRLTSQYTSAQELASLQIAKSNYYNILANLIKNEN